MKKIFPELSNHINDKSVADQSSTEKVCSNCARTCKSIRGGLYQHARHCKAQSEDKKSRIFGCARKIIFIAETTRLIDNCNNKSLISNVETALCNAVFATPETIKIFIQCLTRRLEATLIPSFEKEERSSCDSKSVNEKMSIPLQQDLATLCSRGK